MTTKTVEVDVPVVTGMSSSENVSSSENGPVQKAGQEPPLGAVVGTVGRVFQAGQLVFRVYVARDDSLQLESTKIEAVLKNGKLRVEDRRLAWGCKDVIEPQLVGRNRIETYELFARECRAEIERLEGELQRYRLFEAEGRRLASD